MQKKNNLRIVMLSPSYPPDYTCEVGRHVYYLSQALTKLGVEVHVIAYSSEGCMETEKVDGVNVHRLNLAIMGKEDRVLAHQSKELVAICLQKLSVFHLIHVHDWRFAPAGKFIRDMYKVPLVVTFHQLEFTTGNIDESPSSNTLSIEEKIRRAYSSKVEELTFRDADYFILKSVYLKKKAQELYNLDDNRIDVIPYGVMLKSPNAHFEAKDFRSMFLDAERKKVITFIGNVTEDSEVDTLVDAVSFITYDPSVKIAILTKSSWTHHLHQKIASLKLDDNVLILSDAANEVLSAIYQCTDILVPLGSRGTSLAALEGMAHGILVPVFGEGSAAEVINHEVNGMKMVSNNPHFIGARIINLMKEQSKLAKMRKVAKSETLSKYNASEEAKATLEVYRKVLDL